MQIQERIPISFGRDRLNWLIGALFTLLYAPLLVYWIDGWINKSISIEHEYFSHGLIGFPFAAYIVWSQRQQWAKLRDRAHPVGIGLLAIAAVFYITKTPELVNLSFAIALTGICLALKGVPGLKLQAYPLIFMWLATPNAIPYLIAPFTLPLQQFIAGTAGLILVIFGIPVEVEGIYLTVGGRLVEVAPYCAGLKMLFTSIYVALLLLYWTGANESRSKSIALVVGAAAISVIANIVRNTLLTLFHGTGQDGAFAWLHDGWGGDVYSALMLGLIVLLLKIIDYYDDSPAAQTENSVIEETQASDE
ncbi:MAG: cyanoexosortase B [Spirulinaceae cyanobacterium]